MKKQFILVALLIFSMIICDFSKAQCTEAKDSEMAKYMLLTKTQDAQGCSQCAMLALYFCSAKYCVKSEDVNKVGQMINACKENIRNMGQPYCCPDYLNKVPEWGIMGDNASNSGSNLNSVSNPMINNMSSPSGTSQVLNTLSQLNPNSKELSTYAANYQQGEQIATAVAGIVDLFTPSPEEQARKEQARLESEKRAEELRQRQLQLKIQNENNAKEDFKTNFLIGVDDSDENNRVAAVINGMDNYITKKYTYDVSELLPNWKPWMIEAIRNDNKFVSVVFSAKTLGFCLNKFDYNLGLTVPEAIELLEKVANSGAETTSYLGISWESVQKKIKVKNKKKKLISKDVLVNKVTFVAEGSAAANMGLNIGDEILMINNEQVDHLMHQKIQKFKPGEKIKITYSRDSKEFVKDVALGSTIKNLYNVDAMLVLANYYNVKALGNNPEKTLYYFTKAAENKSPNAMYALAQIYQYNLFGHKKVNVKFKFKNNVAFAHEWYLKSLEDLYYTNSQIKRLYNIGTDFEIKSFDELITMSKKGIGCKKDLLMAEELLKQKTAYLEQISKNN
ncbi:PDZ domain-containing protein [Flavobacterium antarcticum]|uniref:PDZ domain-containing protein n=1 Tax=Flavobacterium antarcticum TaxID=271155 RepID=UPI0003B5A6C9|nr:PDZ domain-containing protein [Flavobacterium antarcticum]